MTRAAFPGSFDPPTLGHMNIIQRSASIFDEITVIVAENRHKQYLFSAGERLDLMSSLVEPWKNVSVALCTGLIVEFLKERDIPVLIRGIRGGGDFSYEFELSLMNRALNPGIETIFFTTDPKYVVIRSSSIKELASFGGNVSAMVPEPVAQALGLKFNPR
ncbi:MAG: pantetheine-phosphate adenylyltransferase [Spirochaetaceae bacterium]|jgi:pantetheine-phosphate adenylyltransferase|nr:pantetheine-phosphate adenylyltransferase [Spirochaetaceae bacterium]